VPSVLVRAVLGVAQHEEAVNAEQRYRTAHHEAGHTVMAYLLGRPVGPVSIRPCEVHLGVSFHRKARIPQHQLE
jgi:ATP-dependent Zn protease